MPFFSEDDFMVDKKELKKKFEAEWKKHYNLDFFKEHGFQRKKCKETGIMFWTLDSEREVCADSTAVGYQFLGKKTKNLDYIEAWKQVEKFFEKKGHTSIPRYPTVCRWRDDLYFTNASIIDFQPYVVTGEIRPPANPLVVPQACIRFGDVSNVGVTGRHNTSFIMVGQHAFNTPETGLFYWKDKAIELDFELVTKVLGANEKDITFQEDVWAGGGTFGPSIEYHVNGLELGNCVFMQFKELGNGKSEELKTKVIDMGAGLERFAWFTQGKATVYDSVYGPVLDELKKDLNVKVEEKIYLEYARNSGMLDVEEHDFKKEKEKLLKKLGANEDFLESLKPLQALYAVADHLKTILYTTTDGMLPSNSGGGYNLRMLLRRVFGFKEEFNFNFDYHKILEGHAKYLKALDPTLIEMTSVTADLIHEEEKKFTQSKVQGRKKIEAVVSRLKKENKPLNVKEIVKLYESDGIPLEIAEDYAKKNGIKVEGIENFYGQLAKNNEIQKEKEKKSLDASKFKKTKLLFYEDQDLNEFTAEVQGLIGNYVVLDKTAFYPVSGGQNHDTGILNEEEVTEVLKEEGVVLHKVKNPGKFKIGAKVFGKIDLERRGILMRQHSGAHILNAAARHLLGKHIWQGGTFKDIDKAHMDLTHYRKLSEEELKKIELEANKLIQLNVPVSSKFYARDEAEKLFGFRIYQGGYVPGKEIRIINMEGIEVEACGGTHVKRSGDIGVFKIIKREGVKDGIERITYTTGIPAMKLIQEKENQIKKATEIMNVPEQELVSSTNRIFSEWKDLRKKLNKANEEKVKEKIKEILKGKQEQVKEFFEEADADFLMKLGNEIVSNNDKSHAIFASGKGDILIIKGIKSKVNAVDLFNEFKKQVDAQGGGSEKLARGRTQSIDKLKNYFN